MGPPLVGADPPLAGQGVRPRANGPAASDEHPRELLKGLLTSFRASKQILIPCRSSDYSDCPKPWPSAPLCVGPRHSSGRGRKVVSRRPDRAGAALKKPTEDHIPLSTALSTRGKKSSATRSGVHRRLLIMKPTQRKASHHSLYPHSQPTPDDALRDRLHSTIPQAGISCHLPRSLQQPNHAH